MEKKEIWETKTFWAGVMLAVSGLLPAFVNIDPPVLEGIKTIIIGLGLIFARVAIENTK